MIISIYISLSSSDFFSVVQLTLECFMSSGFCCIFHHLLMEGGSVQPLEEEEESEPHE